MLLIILPYIFAPDDSPLDKAFEVCRTFEEVHNF